MNELLAGLVGSVGLLVVVLAALALVLYLVPVPLWIAAWASGAYVGLVTLIGMRLMFTDRVSTISIRKRILKVIDCVAPV